MSLVITAAAASGDPSLAVWLLFLLVPFCLILGAVIRLVQTAEDDELVEQLRQGADPDGQLQQVLAALRDTADPGPDDVPTGPVLAAWEARP